MRECEHKITCRCVIEEETEELGEKPLRRPPSGNQSTRQSVGLHGLVRDPSSLIYPMYLNPPSSYSNKASQNRVLFSSPDPAIHPIASAILGFFQYFPATPKPHLTL